MVTDSIKVLVVDDDPDVHRVMGEILGPDHSLLEASDAAEAMRQADLGEPDVVLLDLDLGEGPDGFQVLERLRTLDPDLPVVILSAYHDTDTVVRAMKAGAAHFIEKAPRYDELTERLRLAVQARRQALHLRAHRLPPGKLIGTGPRFEELLEEARHAGEAELPVLIVGETGTGKSLLARLIHRLSERRGSPFLEVNVAALPSTVLNSELFGHEKGAFTGADRRRRGLFELAQGGTIVLDEIGDLSRGDQVKLLQVVEEGRFRRVGGEEDLAVSVQVISATHQDLPEAMEAGDFRSDLYYRLAGLVLRTPALREHPESIPLLAEAYLGNAVALTGEALELLGEQPWPGNVRELHLTLARARAYAGRDTIGAAEVTRALEALPVNRSRSLPEEVFLAPYDEALETVRGRFQKEYVERLLRRCGGNVSEAARRSGISRAHLHELIRKLEIRRGPAAGPG